MTYKACRIPGMYPKQVRRIFRRRTPLQPTSRNTPTGGRMIARIYTDNELATACG
ncbi:hypothetical protein K440DRAFT_615829 [Wilcoxina mikolae CBS 423.85]|nr:hypothetical protein K440DRAFT_615829 [Wilcoxina mikolae CBS 423.85]